MLKIKETAKLAGISKRTLQHYDDIGLLKAERNEAGYRVYGSSQLDDLQQILFFRELGFPLKTIFGILRDPGFDHREALSSHRRLLEEKRKRIDRMIKTIDKTLESKERGIAMDDRERFEGFDFSSGNPHEEEARKRWGNASVEESKSKLKGNEKEMEEAINRIYRKLAELRHLPPDSPEAQSAIGEWYSLLNRIGTYSPEAFEGLGELYVSDERFTESIDRFGEGLARFMRDAMVSYARKNR